MTNLTLDGGACSCAAGKPRTRDLKPCGTDAAYQRHRKAGETPCDACREARRVKSAETNRQLAEQSTKRGRELAAQRKQQRRIDKQERRLVAAAAEVFCGDCGKPFELNGLNPVIHGTRAAYDRHVDDRESPCAACREAYERESRYPPRAREVKPCGTRAAYERHRRKGEPPCDACREAHTAIRHQMYMREGSDVGCASCGKPIQINRKSAAQPMCRPCRTAAQRAELAERATLVPCIPCPVCGTEFRPARKNDGKYTQSCSAACGDVVRWGPADNRARISDSLRWHLKNGQRRKGILTDETPHTLAEIAARDGYRCQLCRRMVDMSLSGNADLGPTRDHIIPVIVSMDDRRTNIQLAHRLCNQQKADKVSGVQLMLTG